MNKSAKRVYCSGPLFCPEEIHGMAEIARVLEGAGYRTFLPHRDGLEPYVMGLANDPRVTNRKFRRINTLVHKAIFALDIYNVVEGCWGLVFNMNGRVPDEGGVVETAVAFATGKPLVIYKTDNRTKFNGYDNSMLSGLSYTFTKVEDMRKIPSELEAVARQLEKSGGPPPGGNFPPHLKSVLDFGRKVERFLGVIRFFESGWQGRLEGLEKLADMCEKFPDAQQLR